MTATALEASARGRTHIVLVPGFVGFDALGQLEYYAGVTEVFQAWKGQGRDVALHYFDNFPTASVKQRADRLVKYLAKRVARGEFAENDRVALVGHSTGALDIRLALHVLIQARAARVTTDGHCAISHQNVLNRIERLCFLSAPHYGTNIADFAYRLGETAQSLFRTAALGVQLNREPISNLRRALAERLPGATRSNLLLAIADALNESDEYLGDSKKNGASEREARAEFALWLEHMSKNFEILNDLRSGGYDTSKDSDTPAHFSAAQRTAELSAWRNLGITTRSYATLAPGSANKKNAVIEPLIRALRAGAPLLNLGSEALTKGSRLWMLPGVSVPAFLAQLTMPVPPSVGVLGVLNRYPTLLFELFCALCAEGPFRSPTALAPNAIQPRIRDFNSGEVIESSSISIAESDGVVNTLSMLWPYDPERPSDHSIFMVKGDHGEIIGHYATKPLVNPDANGRQYYAYDFFQSGTPFDGDCFIKVWHDLFGFCIQ